ncbi:acyl carrier protein [Streptomyces sp. NPDC001668]|uniref:acyl carrier protein n=1 Tax=unclassified Streptomyces TaxID=2593676 RepID=UPI0033C1AC4D
MSADAVVIEVIGQLFDIEADELTLDTTPAEIEGWDSVNQMRILVYLERQLGTSLDYDRFMKAGSLGDLAAVVADALAEGTAA